MGLMMSGSLAKSFSFQPIAPHVRRRGQRGFAVEVDAGVYAFAGHVDLAVAESGDTRHLGVDNALHQRCGHSGIDRITALHKHPRAGFGCFRLRGYDHCVGRLKAHARHSS